MRTTLLAWMPFEVIPLLFVAAGIAVMFGLRGLAAGLAGAGLVAAALPVALGPVFDQTPAWSLYLAMLVMVVGLGLGLAKSVLGGRAWDHMVGILAADVVRWAFVGAVRLMIGIVVVPLRALVRLFRQ